jgi:hypothetical protein
MRRIYRSGALKTAARDLAKYRLDLMGVQTSNGARLALNEQWLMLCVWKRSEIFG